MVYTVQLTLSLLLDSIFGDPRWYPHPVRGIGWLIERTEAVCRRWCENLIVGGTLTVVTVIWVTATIVFFLLYAFSYISPLLADFIAILFIYMAFSTRDLLVHSNAVYSALLSENPLDRGRVEVGKIVGRDTSSLDNEGITRACVETVAENMVDGATAPLFYAIVASFLEPFMPLSAIGCSAIGIFAYKAVNTMDSMLGYKNERYLFFGKVAAKLDDVVNYIPARISGYTIVAAAFFLRYNWKNSYTIYCRDKMNHSSPNAAHPEAAVAGALGVKLGGPSIYFGKIVEKPYIGEPLLTIEPRHIKEANMLVVIAIIIFATLMLSARQIICTVIT